MDEYPSEYDPRFPLRTGGNWTLGDNTTAAVLLENGFRGTGHSARPLCSCPA